MGFHYRIEKFESRRLLSAGNLDPSFSGDGLQTSDFGSAQVTGTAVQSDGKIIVAGHVGAKGSQNFFLARYLSNGNLDSGFGAGGKVITDFGGDDVATDIKIMADGRIVAAGGGGLGADFAVARYNPNGTLDTTFSGDGKATVGFGRIDVATGLALMSDGRIVLAGNRHSNSVPQENGILLARFKSSGALDAAFSGDGKQITVLGPPPFRGPIVDTATNDVAITHDGKIITVGGYFAEVSRTFSVRNNSDGTLDSSFADGAFDVLEFTEDDSFAVSVALQPDDGIIVTEYEYPYYVFFIGRLNADGSSEIFGSVRALDQDDSQGPDFSPDAGVALQADGKIIVATSTNSTDYPAQGFDFLIERYNADGMLDKGFGNAGIVTTNFIAAPGGGLPSDDRAVCLAIAPDGKIVVAGESDGRVAVARYLDTNVPRLIGNQLLIDGTVLADTIVVQRVDAERLSVQIVTGSDSIAQTFPIADVKGIAISGGAGNDVIRIGDGLIGVSASGNGGRDLIIGGSGNDRLLGGPGRDTLKGGSGDDVLIGGSGGDFMYGGDGSDLADYSDRTGNLSLSIDDLPNDGAAGEGDNIAVTTEKIKGGSRNDNIIGDAGRNVLYGGGGNDTLTGLGSADALYGQSGDDRLLARDNAQDYLDGGSGTDQTQIDSIDNLLSIESFIP